MVITLGVLSSVSEQVHAENIAAYAADCCEVKLSTYNCCVLSWVNLKLLLTSARKFDTQRSGKS